MQMSAMKARFQIAECSLSSAKVMKIFANPKNNTVFLDYNPKIRTDFLD